jgi:hypothetical protein
LNRQGYAIALFEHALCKLKHESATPLLLVQSGESANDFSSLVELFKLGFTESRSQIDAIVAKL